MNYDENDETIFKLLPKCYFLISPWTILFIQTPMGFGSCRRPIGILHQWQIMAQNLTFLVRWNLIFPIFSSYISPVSHDNFKAGHGQNSGISPFSFWLLWTLWSGTIRVEHDLVTIYGTWLGWWFGTWLGTWLLYDFIYFHIFSYMGCHPSHWRSHMFQDG